MVGKYHSIDNVYRPSSLRGVPVKWADVDFENRILKIRQPKSGYDETIPLNGEALAILKGQEHFSRGWSEIIFPGYQGNQRRTIEHAWANIKKKAGLPKSYRLHDLRHTFASRLVAKVCRYISFKNFCGTVRPL